MHFGLGSTDSCATAVHTKPFSTSVLQGLAGVFATTTRSAAAPGRLAPRPFCAHRRDPPTRQGFVAALLRQRLDAAHLPLTAEYRLDASAPSISGLVASAGELLHSLSGFRLPWPPSCCLKQPTPFMVSHERRVGRLNSAFGSSHSASSAYQKWPTWHSDPRCSWLHSSRKPEISPSLRIG
ncbi:hypothetical protein P5V15_015338 [Pogonomyrmex californicus]